MLQAILVLKVLDHLTMVFFTLGELNNEKYFPLKNIDLQGGLHFLPDSISKHFCLFHFLLLNIDIVKSRLHSCVIQIIGKIKCYFLEFYQNFSFRIYCSIFLCSSKMEVHQESSEHCWHLGHHSLFSQLYLGGIQGLLIEYLQIHSSSWSGYSGDWSRGETVETGESHEDIESVQAGQTFHWSPGTNSLLWLVVTKEYLLLIGWF